jgi:hypothetical protein
MIKRLGLNASYYRHSYCLLSLTAILHNQLIISKLCYFL